LRRISSASYDRSGAMRERWTWLAGASIEATRVPLLFGVAADIVVAAYALTLPHTPPERPAPDAPRVPLARRGSLLRNRPLLVFLAVALLGCVPSMAYNNYSNAFLNLRGYPSPAALMTLGQVSEVAMLLAMPWMIHRVGLKGLFLAGLLAWAARYGCLALGAAAGASWAIYAAILVHGPCFAFIYIAGPMYVDHLTPPAQRGLVQGSFAVAATGFGHLLGALLVGRCQEVFLTPPGVSPPPYDWTMFWLVPGAISLATALAYWLWVCPQRKVSVGAAQ